MRQIRSRMRAAIALALSLAIRRTCWRDGHVRLQTGRIPGDRWRNLTGQEVLYCCGENKAGEFGVYLRDAQTKKLIGQLEEVATELDSAPDAYHAHWAPDSKHVGVSSRADRHWRTTSSIALRIDAPILVETPQLMCHAVPEFCQLRKKLGGAAHFG